MERALSSLMSFLIVIVGISPLVMLGVAYAVYVRWPRTAFEKKRRSVVFFVLGLLVVGALSGMLGLVAVAGALCALYPYRNPGCIDAGFFFGGTLGFSVGAGVYLYFWAREGESP